MAQLEIELPPDLEMRLSRLVDQGEFDSLEHAASQMVSIGVDAYRTGNADDPDDEFHDDMMGDDMMGHDDEYAF